MDLDLDKYIKKYNNVSPEEIKKLATVHLDSMGESTFESLICGYHKKRESVKQNGRKALQTRPLAQVLSVIVQRTNAKKDTPLIYGKICAELSKTGVTEEYVLFNRDRSVGEIIGPTNKLDLVGPEFSCWPPRMCTPLSLINVSLYNGDNHVFAKHCFCLDDAEDDYEKVISREIPCARGYRLTMTYIIIPFGVNCRIRVELFKRNFRDNQVNVNGKITTRYSNTYGNFEGECVLFEKQGTDYEQAKFENTTARLKMPTCCVASPVHSPLIVTLELSEFGTGREIVHDTIKLLPAALGSAESFLREEMGLYIMVQAEWYQPNPYGRCKISNEESEVDSNLELPWCLKRHKKKIWPSPAVEIFSVFIGREKSKAVQVYGSIEVLIDDKSKYYILQREGKNPLMLQDNENTTPILDGSRLFENFSSLGIKVDLKDVDGPLAIKGFVNWDSRILASDYYHEKQLCSSILGKNGFTAVHYSIFSEAVLANIEVYLNLNKGCVDVYPKVSGSVIAQYSCFNYSTRYNEDYYRIMLFKRSQDDSVETSSNRTIPLSRSMVVVPLYSSLIVNVDLSFGDSSGEMLSCVGSLEIKIDDGEKTIKTNDYSLCMQVDWCEIK